MNTLKKHRLRLGVTFSILFVLTLLCVIPKHIDIPEHRILNLSETGNISIVPESQYAEIMSTVVEPDLDKIKHTGTFTTKNGYENYYEYFLVNNPIGSIVISHGFTESVNKYYEIIYYFTQAGYNVFGADHTGHGYSARHVSDLSLTHIENYQQYLDDFTSFINEVVVKNSTSDNYYLYAHSMGGNIGTLFLEESPDFFQGAILSTPMLSLNTGMVPNFIANAIAKVYTAIGKGTTYTFSHGPFTPDYIDKSGTSIAQIRHDYFFDKKLDDELLQTNGSSFHWLKSSFEAAKRATSIKNTAKIKTPILLFQAANDTMVSKEGHYKFIKQLSNAELVIVENAAHELYQANDSILPAYLNQMFKFLKDNA